MFFFVYPYCAIVFVILVGERTMLSLRYVVAGDLLPFQIQSFVPAQRKKKKICLSKDGGAIKLTGDPFGLVAVRLTHFLFTPFLFANKKLISLQLLSGVNAII